MSNEKDDKRKKQQITKLIDQELLQENQQHQIEIARRAREEAEIAAQERPETRRRVRFLTPDWKEKEEKKAIRKVQEKLRQQLEIQKNERTRKNNEKIAAKEEEQREEIEIQEMRQRLKEKREMLKIQRIKEQEAREEKEWKEKWKRIEREEKEW